MQPTKLEPIGVTGDWAWTALAGLIGIAVMLGVLQWVKVDLIESLSFFAVLTAAAGAILRASVHGGSDPLSKRTDHAGKLLTVTGLSGGITGAASRLESLWWAVPVYGVLAASLVIGIIIEVRRYQAKKRAPSNV